MNRTIPIAADHACDGWLAVSTEGFAAMNAGRESAHLVKELVQNALDAIDEGGIIELDCRPGPEPGTMRITCRDNGCGMHELADIRTVFHTSKTDRHTQRGRMGRGFKEMLCLALHATVTSNHRRIEFVIESGRRLTRQSRVPDRHVVRGTQVEMLMPWGPERIGELEGYFQTLLVSPGVRLIVNGRCIQPRRPVHRIEATLPTELYEQGRWIRPARKAAIELVKLQPGEEPMVYELGIPVCPVEWTAPYHANVLQRVPMNPCRDAVASGFLLKLHKACLPTLLPELSSEQVRQDWVGSAAPHCDADTQQQIIAKGFGQNLARSVPKMGVRQFDEDAREVGVNVIDTKHTAGGFRQILQQHVPTTRQVVDQHNQKLVQAAAAGSFAVGDVYRAEDEASHRRRELIEAVGGPARVEQVMSFAGWLCQRLLDGYGGSAVVAVMLALLQPAGAVATWSCDDVLTLGIDTPWLWSDPLGEESLSTLIHECAHHLNAHHGRDFHRELEVLAGRAARIMLLQGAQVRETFPTLWPAAGTQAAAAERNNT